MITRIPIILDLKNIYNYLEFIELCKERNVPLYSWLLYVQKVETLIAGMDMYKDITPIEAYNKYVSNNQNTLVQNIEDRKIINELPSVVNCGGCGGGEVR